MADGSIKKLGQIEIGDLVTTNRGRGRRVVEIFEHPGKECVRFTTKTGRQLVAALDHTMCTSKGWKFAADTKVGEGLALLRHFEANRVSDRSEAEFRLLGYILGDGCVSDGSGKIAAVNEEEIADIKKCVETLGKEKGDERISWRLESGAVCFRGMLPWLRETSLYGKMAYTKSLPSWARTASNKQIAHLLACYFATDGGITDPAVKRKSGEKAGKSLPPIIDFGSVSKELLEGIQSLLSRFDIVSNLYPKKSRCTQTGKACFSHVLVIESKRNFEKFLHEIGPFVRHSDKVAKMKAWESVLPSICDKGTPWFTAEELDEIRTSKQSRQALVKKYGLKSDHAIFNIQHGVTDLLPLSQDYFFDEIVSMEPCVADCRCLTVDEDETFVVKDIVVHNSTMISHWTPVTFLEMFPHKRVILTSSEGGYAAEWGGKVRQTFLEHQEELSTRLVGRPPAKEDWKTTMGGGMVCAGVGGMITGRGADLFIIDDYIRNSEEANSPTIRNKVWDWYTSTARSRLEPGASMVILATRWHSDDLIGRLTDKSFYADEDDRDDWEVLVLPALADPESEAYYRNRGCRVNELRTSLIKVPQSASPGEWRDILGRKAGEALCPERYDEKELRKIRSNSIRDWYSLYQCRPGDEANDGNVYYQFDSQRNTGQLVRDFTMQLFVSIDFGVAPIVAVIGQYERDEVNGGLMRMDVLEEIYIREGSVHTLMDKVCRELMKYCWRQTYVEFYGDAAGIQKAAQSQKSCWDIVAEIVAYSPNIQPAYRRLTKNPQIVDRVNAVNSQLYSVDKVVRLRMHETKCPELIMDMKRVKWAQDSSGNSMGTQDKSDKWRTHLSDALGYAVERLAGRRRKGGARKGFVR